MKIEPDYASDKTEKEEQLEEKEFCVQAWFLDEYKSDTTQQNYQPPTENNMPEINKRYKLNALPRLLDQLISACLEKMDIMKDLVVELFLPLAFLNATDCNIHQWTVDVGLENYKAISCVYPLVVRSLDRIKYGNVNMLRKWKRNWYRLNQQETIAQPRFLSNEHCGEDISLEGNTCLAFVVVPPPIHYSIRKPPRHIFTWMLRDGISVALWPRWSETSLHETQIREAYTDILVGRHFSELPELIWQKRKEEKHLLVVSSQYFGVAWAESVGQ